MLFYSLASLQVALGLFRRSAPIALMFIAIAAVLDGLAARRPEYSCP